MASTEVQTVDVTHLAVFAPEQEAYLAKLAAVGVDKEAIAAAGIDRRTLRAWREDRSFAAACDEAARDYTDTMIRLGYEAVEKAQPDELLNHPNLLMFNVKQRDNSFRDSVTVINDNRKQTVNVLTDEQCEAVARALAGIPEGEDVP